MPEYWGRVKLVLVLVLGAAVLPNIAAKGGSAASSAADVASTGGEADGRKKSLPNPPEQLPTDNVMKMTGMHINIITVEDSAHVVVRHDRFNQSSPVLPKGMWSGPLMIMLQELSSGIWADFTYNITLAPTPGSYGMACNRVIQRTPEPGWQRPADMYWAATYVTPGRLAATKMITAHTQAPMSLAVPLQDEFAPTFEGMNRLFNWTKPFSPGLWLAMLVITVFAGMTQKLIDSKSPDFVYRHIPMEDFLDNVTSAIYLALMTFTGGNTFEPRSLRGKMFSAAWTFFCMVMVACYTASLANYLSHNTVAAAKFKSISQFWSSHRTACVLDGSAYGKWLKGHPQYKFMNFRECANVKAMLEAAQDGYCDGIIHTTETNTMLVEGGLFCEPPLDKLELEIVDRFHDGFSNMAFGLSRDLSNTDALADRLSYWVSKYVSSGRVDAIYSDMNAMGGCSSVAGADASTTEGQIGLADSGGVFILLLVVAGAVVVLKLLEDVDVARKQRKHGNMSHFMEWFHEEHGEKMGLPHPLWVLHCRRETRRSQFPGPNPKKAHAEENEEQQAAKREEYAAEAAMMASHVTREEDHEGGDGRHEDAINAAVLQAWLDYKAIRELILVPVWLFIVRSDALAEDDIQGVVWKHNNELLVQMHLHTYGALIDKCDPNDPLVIILTNLLKAVLEAWWFDLRNSEAVMHEVREAVGNLNSVDPKAVAQQMWRSTFGTIITQTEAAASKIARAIDKKRHKDKATRTEVPNPIHSIKGQDVARAEPAFPTSPHKSPRTELAELASLRASRQSTTKEDEAAMRRKDEEAELAELRIRRARGARGAGQSKQSDHVP